MLAFSELMQMVVIREAEQLVYRIEARIVLSCRRRRGRVLVDRLLRGTDPSVVLPVDFLAFARAVESCRTSSAALETLREGILGFLAGGASRGRYRGSVDVVQGGFEVLFVFLE